MNGSPNNRWEYTIITNPADGDVGAIMEQPCCEVFVYSINTSYNPAPEEAYHSIAILKPREITEPPVQ